MIHFVHVVHVDPERAAAAGKAILLFGLAWLAWHFLPESWVVSAWLGTIWHAVITPFVWVAGICAWLIGAAISILQFVLVALRFLATSQAALLPIWALLAGLCLSSDEPEQSSLFWLGFAALDAACTALLGTPLLGGMIAFGSVAALCAVLTLSVSARRWVGWSATAAVAAISTWGTWQFGVAFGPACWLLAPVSWTLLALGAAWGHKLQANGGSGRGGALRLLLVAVVLVMATASPFVVDAARAGALLPGREAPIVSQPDHTIPPRTPPDRVAVTAQQRPPIQDRRVDHKHGERRTR